MCLCVPHNTRNIALHTVAAGFAICMHPAHHRWWHCAHVCSLPGCFPSAAVFGSMPLTAATWASRVTEAGFAMCFHNVAPRPLPLLHRLPVCSRPCCSAPAGALPFEGFKVFKCAVDSTPQFIAPYFATEGVGWVGSIWLSGCHESKQGLPTQDPPGNTVYRWPA